MATTTLIDGCKDQSGGMDASRSPENISEKHFSLGVNVVARDGMLSTRPMFRRVELPVSAAVRTGYFQGAIGYSNHASGVKLVVAVFDGRVYAFDPVALTPTDLSAASGLVNDTAAPHYFCDVEGTLVISNGRDGALLFDGVKLRRASTDEVPTCTIMAFGQGRLVAVSPDKREFVMGDLAYGGSLASIPITLSSPVAGSNTTRLTTTKPHGFTTGDTVTIRRHYTTPAITGTWTITVTGDTTFTIPVTLQAGSSGGEVLKSNEGQANDALRFTEWKFANERGVFRLPSKFGPITAAVFFPVQDTGTGQGDLLVAGRNGACGFAVSQPRETWLNIQIQREALTKIGFSGHLAHAQVNGDIFFTSRDGLRSYRNARAEFGQYGNTPLSAEIESLLSGFTQLSRERASMALHDNRLLFTVAPRLLAASTSDGPRRCVYRALAALDFQQSSRISKDALAAYDGIWTGLDFLQLIPCAFDDQERLYAFCWQQTEDGGGRENQLWEITARNTGNDEWQLCGSNAVQRQKIDSAAELRAFEFGDWKMEKRLSRLEIWLDSIRATQAALSIYWRPDVHSGGWFKWLENLLLTPDSCAYLGAVGDCAESPKVRPDFSVSPLPVGTPPQYEDAISNRLADRGFTFQLRLGWSGRLRVKKLLTYAEPLVAPTQSDLTSRPVADNSGEVVPPAPVWLDRQSYNIFPSPACEYTPCMNTAFWPTAGPIFMDALMIADASGAAPIQVFAGARRLFRGSIGDGVVVYSANFENGFAIAYMDLRVVTPEDPDYTENSVRVRLVPDVAEFATQWLLVLPVAVCFDLPLEISLNSSFTH